MGKATRNRAASARERIAAQQAAARRAETRRRMIIGGGSVLAVLAVVVALVLYSVVSKQSAKPGATTKGALPASVQHDISTVPVATLAAVGKGSTLSYSSNPVIKISGAQLTAAGKPEMLYIGAEYCPYCAAARWAMAVALSRFGTLSPLHGIHSSPTDVDPNTPTVTFYRTSYTSKYLTFTPVENEGPTRNLLQPTTAAQTALWKQYEPGGQTGYPFMDFGNQLAIVQPPVNPAVLAGQTWAQVAAALHDPSSPIAQAEDGAANYITAAICKITNNQPASICAAAPISTLEAGL